MAGSPRQRALLKVARDIYRRNSQIFCLEE